MNKTLIKTVVTAALIFGFAAAPALADAPVVTITGITGVDLASPYVMGSGTLTVNTTPTTVSINGTVVHDPNTNPINSVNLYVNTVLESSQGIPNNIGDTFNFNLPWLIPSAGNYTLTVTAKHGNCPTCSGSDEEVLAVIDLGSGGPGPSVNCPAAPAIAAAYMQTKIKPGSAQWKKAITAVAGETGSSGIFWAKYACGGGPNNHGITYPSPSAYATAVVNFIKAVPYNIP